MRHLVVTAYAFVVMCCGAAHAASPGIHVTEGSAYFEDADRNRELLANGAGDDHATLSPDRTRLVWTHAASRNSDVTSLWIFDASSRQRRALYESGDGWIEGAPLFSLNGGYVYFNIGSGGPGCRVHQISVATGREKTVTGGGCLDAILRTGPYRGYLIVERHLYHNTAAGGSYDVDYVVRPDGVDQFPIPGTDDASQPTARNTWLKSKGWTAW